MQFIFYVFSYNRGRFLENCIESIRRNAPGYPIVVVDDDSNDPVTLGVLEALPKDIRIMKSRKSADGRYGGLYLNLQMAYEDAPEDCIAIFLQDDGQVVRPLTPEDFQYIIDYFEAFPRAAFLNPHFPMQLRRSGVERAMRLDAEFPVYFYHHSDRWKDRSVTMYYTDIAIVHIARMRAAGFAYQDSESSSAVRARELFSRMGKMVYPFYAYLPEVPVYHGKKKTLGLKLAERVMGVEPNRYRDMTPEQVATMKSRDLHEFPYAENYLSCLGRQPRKPYTNKGINAILLFRTLHKIELALKKAFRGR